MLRTSLMRPAARFVVGTGKTQSARLAHTISTPTLVNLSKRWESMSPEEQADIQSQLVKRQEGPWTELTPEEKRAAYFVAFGEHGPRANVHPKGFQYRVIVGTVLGLAASSVMFYGIRLMANPPPRTMSREYQEAMTEQAKEQNIEPISGISSEGYVGKGYVQSD